MITLTSPRAGDTYTATWSLSDYPASAGWVLRLTLASAAARYQAAASASGNDHVLTVAASTTAGWAAGAYTWVVDATLAGVRKTVANGTTQILPDLAKTTQTGYDGRSPYQKALDNAETALITHGANAYLESIQVGDRKQVFTAQGDFLAFISRLRYEVRREQQADRLRQGLPPASTLYARFRTR